MSPLIAEHSGRVRCASLSIWPGLVQREHQPAHDSVSHVSLQRRSTGLVEEAHNEPGRASVLRCPSILTLPSHHEEEEEEEVGVRQSIASEFRTSPLPRIVASAAIQEEETPLVVVTV